VKQKIIFPKIQGTLTEPSKRTELHYMFCGIHVEEHYALEWIISFWQNNTKTMCETPKRGGLAEPLNKGARDDLLVCLPWYPSLNTIYIQNL